jgi:hypothetical protein
MRLPIALAASLLLALPAPAAIAQGFVEVDRVTMLDLDPDANDAANFGETLAVNDRFAFIGAPNRGPSQRGGAWLFELRADGELHFLADLLPAESTFKFGLQIAVDGDWAAISERGNKVRLYQRSGMNWTLAQTILLAQVPSTPGVNVRGIYDGLDLTGDLLVMGDASANVDGGGGSVSNAGAVVIYRRGPGGVWAHEATVVSPALVNSSKFGANVAVSGNTLLVGAANDLVGDVRAGRAWIYQRSGSTWSAAAALINQQDEGNADFGWSVALDGDVAIVGCRLCNIGVDIPTNAGSFHAFERNLGGPGAWGQRGEYASSTPSFIDEFSVSLRLRGAVLAVGATGSSAKSAYFFSRRGDGSWREEARMQIPEPNNHDFGSQVDFAGGRALVSADQFPDVSQVRYGVAVSFLNPILEACGGDFDRIFCDGFEGGTPLAAARSGATSGD